MISSNRGRSWHLFPRTSVRCVLDRMGSSHAQHHPYLGTNRQKRAAHRAYGSKTVGWAGESGLPLAAKQRDLYLFSSPSICHDQRSDSIPPGTHLLL